MPGFGSHVVAQITNRFRIVRSSDHLVCNVNASCISYTQQAQHGAFKRDDECGLVSLQNSVHGHWCLCQPDAN